MKLLSFLSKLSALLTLSTKINVLDERFGQIEDGLERGFFKQRLNFV